MNIKSKSAKSKPVKSAEAAAPSKSKKPVPPVPQSYACSVGIFTPPKEPKKKIPMFHIHPTDDDGDAKTDIRLVSFSVAKAKLVLNFADDIREFIKDNS